MKRKIIIAFMLATLVTSGQAQWLEKTIYLPDSLTGIPEPKRQKEDPFIMMRKKNDLL